MWPDPRFVTGISTITIGLFIIAIPLRLWFIHPINRVFKLGPFITEAGFRAVLENRPTFFAIGLYLLLNGASRVFYGLQSVGYVSDNFVNVVGGAEALLSIWAGVLTVIGAHRIWIRK